MLLVTLRSTKPRERYKLTTPSQGHKRQVVNIPKVNVGNVEELSNRGEKNQNLEPK